MKMQRYTPWTIALIFVCLIHSNGVGKAFATRGDPLHAQLVSVGVLRFQDDSGMGLPPEVGQKLAQDFQQKLAVTFKDLLPRVISGTDVPASNSLTMEQVVAVGKQNGVKFVIRGGLLALTSEKTGQEVKVSAQLYAEVISIDAASIVNTLRAEGAGTQAGAMETLATIDLKSDQFRGSAADQALSAAIVQLAEQSHQAVTAPASTESQPTVESGNTESNLAGAQTEAAQAAESDAELQQLIAQAEGILSNSTNVSTESISAVSKSLEALKSTLASKASLMETGQDTTQVEQELATHKEALQTAVAQVTSEVSASSETTSGEVEQPSGEKKGLLSSIDGFASQALSILQKIQEIRAAVLGVKESAGSGGTDSTNYESTPVEEPVSEASGVVVDENGNPIENANVSDQESGAETTTDSSGMYALKGLVSGKIAKLLVTKGQMKMNAQADVWPGHPTIVDFQYKFANGKTSGFAVLPSTVLLNTSKTQPANRGILRGIVQDPQGRPVPRALVILKGLGVARTNSQGQYAFLSVPSGPQQLIVNQNGLKTKSTPIQVVAKKSNDARIQFAPADKVAKPSAKGSLIVRQAGSMLRGTILDNENHPVVGAKVSVIQQVWSANVLTGPKGSFELKNLKPGPYRMVVSRVGFESTSQNIVLTANGTENRNLQLRKQNSPLIAGVLKRETERRSTNSGNPTVTNRTQVNNSVNRTTDSNIKTEKQKVQPTETVSRTGIRPSDRPQISTASVTGQVIDATTRRPIAGAAISIPGHQDAITDLSGRFLIKNLAPGTYQISVGKTGYSSDQRSVGLRQGEAITVSFTLRTRLVPSIRRPRP
jgi:Carboxypeptidase regulatory-like domain